MFYEPESDEIHLENLKGGLQNAEFEMANLLRIVINYKQSIGPYQVILQQIEAFEQNVCEMINKLNEREDIEVIYKNTDKIQQPEEILEEFVEELEVIFTDIIPSKPKFFFAKEVITEFYGKAVFYLIIQDNVGYLFYFDCNDQAINEEILDIFEKYFKHYNLELRIYFDNPKHQLT